jgi:hypothetical protein
LKEGGCRDWREVLAGVQASDHSLRKNFCAKAERGGSASKGKDAWNSFRFTAQSALIDQNRLALKNHRAWKRNKFRAPESSRAARILPYRTAARLSRNQIVVVVLVLVIGGTIEDENELRATTIPGAPEFICRRFE